MSTLGNGSNLIRENGSAADSDTLKFANLVAADLTFSRSLTDTNDLVVTVNSTGKQITVDNQFSGTASAIEKIQFADGAVWDSNTILANSRLFIGASAGETINGTSGNDTIVGNGGDDTLHGNAGNDTYIYARGDGNDLIQENGSSADSDTLRFTNLNAWDLSFARSLADANDLVVTVNSTGEKITIDNHFSGPASGVEQLQFADGSSWNRSNPVDATSTFTWTGGVSSTTLTGNDYGFNIFQFGAGSETAFGGARSNVYQVTTSTGQVQTNLSSATGSKNEIDFLSGITSQNLWFEHAGNDLKIDLLGTNTSTTISNWFSGSSTALQEVAAGSLKIDSQISQLVQAMASYSSNNTGFDPTNSSIHTLPNDTALQSAIGAAWHA